MFSILGQNLFLFKKFMLLFLLKLTFLLYIFEKKN